MSFISGIKSYFTNQSIKEEEAKENSVLQTIIQEILNQLKTLALDSKGHFCIQQSMQIELKKNNQEKINNLFVESVKKLEENGIKILNFDQFSLNFKIILNKTDSKIGDFREIFDYLSELCSPPNRKVFKLLNGADLNSTVLQQCTVNELNEVFRKNGEIERVKEEEHRTTQQIQGLSQSEFLSSDQAKGLNLGIEKDALVKEFLNGYDSFSEGRFVIEIPSCIKRIRSYKDAFTEMKKTTDSEKKKILEEKLIEIKNEIYSHFINPITAKDDEVNISAKTRKNFLNKKDLEPSESLFDEILGELSVSNEENVTSYKTESGIVDILVGVDEKDKQNKEKLKTRNRSVTLQFKAFQSILKPEDEICNSPKGDPEAPKGDPKIVETKVSVIHLPQKPLGNTAFQKELQKKLQEKLAKSK